MMDRSRSGPRTAGIRIFIAAWVAAAIVAASGAARAENEAAAWEALRQGGHIAIMRHALAPGTGDPARFTLEDCATQRNLSAEGRAQARKIGDAFRANKVAVVGVYSSQWCRCLDTAALLELGPVNELAALNSFFANPERGDAQMDALWAWLVDNPSEGTKVLVTHQVVVTAVTGVWPRSGETIVFRVTGDKTLEQVGRIPPPR